MLKSKIMQKLTRNFTLALLVFAVLIGSVFWLLHRNQTYEVKRQELLATAESLASAISNEQVLQGKLGFKGLGNYFNLMTDVASSGIWLVELDGTLTTFQPRGKMHGMMGQGANQEIILMYQSLPATVVAQIELVLAGNTITTEDFSGWLGRQTLTVGTPIYQTSEAISGAILLHAPFYAIDATIRADLLVFLSSTLIALLIALLIAVALSYSFSKPLKVMSNNALALAEGDYSVRNQLNQADEIGELATILDELAERLTDASLAQDQLDQMRQDFMMNISHELKTPLAVIRGSIEVLEHKIVTDPNKVAAYQAQILTEINYLERLVTDLFDLARLQNLDFKIERTRINLVDVLTDAYRGAERLAATKGVKLQLNLIAKQQEFFGDYGRLRQMFLIVLDNAIKYSPPASVVQLTFIEQEIQICDTGSGIDPADAPYIFQRFYRSSDSNATTGTGLGLAIAAEIAKRHAIELSFENLKPHGTCFKFTLKT